MADRHLTHFFVHLLKDAKASPKTTNSDTVPVTSEHHGPPRAALVRIVSVISRLPAALGHPEASQSEGF